MNILSAFVRTFGTVYHGGFVVKSVMQNKWARGAICAESSKVEITI